MNCLSLKPCFKPSSIRKNIHPGFRILRKWFQFLSYLLHLFIQPFIQDYNLASHTTYVINLSNIYEWRETYSLKSTLNERFFDFFFSRNLLSGKRLKKYFFIFPLVGDIWSGILIDSSHSNQPIHCLLECGACLSSCNPLFRITT